MTKIQLRRGNASQWASANPVLAAGEAGFESDTGQLKVGNGTAAWSALGYYGHIPTDVGQAFTAKSDAKVGVSNIYVPSDSTGAIATRWPRRWLAHEASKNTDALVDMITWDDATKTRNAPDVIQAGTAPATGIVTKDTFSRNGDLYGSTPDIGGAWGGFANSAGDWTLNGTQAVRTTDATTSEQISNSGVTGDRIVRITGVTVVTTGQAATQQFRLITKRVSSTTMLYGYLNISTTGIATWGISKNIGGTTTTVVTGAANPLTANSATPQAANMTLTVAGTAVSFTLNGTTINGTLTSDDVTTLAPGTTDGWTGGTVGGMVIGDFEVEVTTAGAVPRQIHMYNGALTGSTLDYQTTWLTQQCPVTPELVIINSCHNYGSDSPATYLGKLDAFVTLVRATWPTAGIVIMSQNPEKPPAANQNTHLLRLLAIRSWAAKRGIGYIPVMEAFRAKSDLGVSLIRNDGVHPTDTTDTADPNNGAFVWTDAVSDYFDALRLAPS
ncbi:hypothetical protein [Williamsia sp. DF01-3]|uniref:hyaluronate lyase N-terminal domain-containing protein n=1 Tax=Williamsia sp. DF01-3 TaxID=2934157 RepID=UPI001FF282C4|nr:hypothetical protein [Williamsia sp. DF01-3]MCK0517851.1 hypothetical protein [Williamsia sp. DF01-3]